MSKPDWTALLPFSANSVEQALLNIAGDARLFHETLQAINEVLASRRVRIMLPNDEGKWFVYNDNGTETFGKFRSIGDAIAWAFKEPEE